jgi:hypothetical protein
MPVFGMMKYQKKPINTVILNSDSSSDEESQESKTLEKIIFNPSQNINGWGGGDGGGHNDPNNRRLPIIIESRKKFNIFTSIQLIKKDDLAENIKLITKTWPIFSFYNQKFQWNNPSIKQASGDFEYLEDAIYNSQLNGFFDGWFHIRSTQLTITPKWKSGLQKVNTQKNFTLFVVTPNSMDYIKIALRVALANSRIRDLHEGLYAIIEEFNKKKAHEFSMLPNQNTLIVTEILLDEAASYCNHTNIKTINKLLWKPGNKDYLSKLRAISIPKEPPLKPHVLSYKNYFQYLLQFYGLFNSALFLKKVWRTKKFPPLPSNFLQSLHSFTVLLGTGLVIKNLFQKIEPFMYKNKKE